MTGMGPVLVTGATGFLGSHAVRRLLADGREVHVYLRPGASLERLAGVQNDIHRHTGDLLDPAAIAAAAREGGITGILHCAGDTSARRFSGDWRAVERAMTVNLRGVLSVLEGASVVGTVRTVVRFGGLEEYGRAPTPWVETQREEPSSPYSASQVAASHACQALQPHLPFAAITLRPALVYGPWQSEDFLIPALITSLLRGERFAMTDGTQGRDLVYVDDVMDAALLAIDRMDLRGAVLNISSGREWAVADVARQIAALLKASGRLDVGASPPRPGEVGSLVGENSRARQSLDWQPKTDLQEGLARTVAWYQGRLTPGSS